MNRRHELLLVVLLAVSAGWGLSRLQAPARAAGPVTERSSYGAGESRTLLPDGRWLLAGGDGPAGPLAIVAIEDPNTGDVTIVGSLASARAWHTATVLPDGGVFVFGGIGTADQVLMDAERFDPGTQSLQAITLDATPRALHTATVLTDGRLLVVGGISRGGEPLGSLTLWDFRTGTVETVPAQLETPRYGHRAALLPNGVVVLWGGFDREGNALDNAEFFDPVSQQVTADGVFVPPFDTGAPELAGSVPEDGATDVPVQSLLALRFSKALQVETVNGGTVQLDGPDGAVSAKVVPAEGGMLVFVTPLMPLRPGVTYALTVEGATDENGLALRATTIRFTTAGTAGAGGAPPEAPSPATPPTVSGATSPLPSSAGDEAWVPDPAHPENWRTGRPLSPWQSLPALRAKRGVTAVAGQVLRLNGEPLPHVVLQIGQATTRTDATGRFLLSGVPAGWQQLWIDGGPTHGTYEVAVVLRAGETNVLPYTIWLPKLDLAHAVTIPSPMTQETVITNPTMPGLEVHLPPGTVIYDHDGKVVTRVSLTPVPLDRPPFPLPNIPVPIYFTIQPGGSYVQTPRGTGARVFYPNVHHAPPGTRFDYWDYDADERGWYIYGQATVSAKHPEEIIPDPGVFLYEFTGAMENCNGPSCVPPASGPPPGCNGGCCDPGFGPGSDDSSGSCGGGGAGDGSYGGEPVSLADGLFVFRNTDLFVPDVIPIRITRTYRPGDLTLRPFGEGTTHPYELYLADPQVGTQQAYQEADLILPDGGRIVYKRTNCGDNCAGRCSATCSCTLPCTPANAVFEHHAPTTTCPNCVGSPTPFDGSTLSEYDGNQYVWGWWTLTLKNGTIYHFPLNGKLSFIQDRFGNRLNITRNDLSAPVTRITSPNGRWVDFTNAACCPTCSTTCVTQIKDNTGRTVQYAYDTSSRLTTVTDANGGVTTYDYNDTYPDDRTTQLIRIRDGNQNASCGRTSATAPPCSSTPTLGLTYYGTNKVWTQTLADGTSQYTFTYQPDSVCVGGPNEGGACTDINQCRPSGGSSGLCVGSTTTVMDPRNYQRVVRFNVAGYSLVDSQGSGARVVTYSRQNGSNLVTARVEPLTPPPTCRNRQTTFGYDPLGNGDLLTLTVTSGPCGGPYATSLTQTAFTYEPTFHQLQTIQTAVGTPAAATTTFTYDEGDPRVRLTSITDGAGFVFPVTINGAGQLASISDASPQHHATTFSYDGGDLVAVTDATNNTTRRFVDAAGRVRSVTDPLGYVTHYDYDNLNLRVVSDPQNNGIVFYYDFDGNLTSIRDLRHPPSWATTSYHYNALNQLDQRTDPLTRMEMFSYDALGNLTTYTDRKGVVTDFKYDELNRRTCAGFGRTAGAQANCQIGGPYTSVVTYGYDSGNRLRQAQDSLAGSITRGYDDLDNLTSETTPQGSISYLYDAASRRQTMTIAGQTVGYCYDGANRLTKIIQGTSCTTAPTLVGISYDEAGRRGKVTLPNADTVTYNYKDNGWISSVQYGVAGTTYGLTYTYDAAGNRIRLGSDWARTGLPAAMSSAAYDKADELTSWNGVALPANPYDNDGNLWHDGTNTYTWNARNQLSGITGGMTASFGYDAFGRRTSKTVGGVTTNFLYDGLNPVQELVGGTVTANLLTGLGIDEFFSRTTGSGNSAVTRVFMPDALGSTIALTDQSATSQNGTLQTQYRYEPFGQESLVSGSPSDSNPYQFTGRENDAICQGGTNAGKSCTSNADCGSGGTCVAGGPRACQGGPTPGLSCTTDANCGSGGTCAPTGLYYYRARYYQPIWGRFISEDPIFLAEGPRNPNRYAYVRNNPLRMRDPFGLYGTNDCGYYGGRCRDNPDNKYYCIIAPAACNTFPKPPDPDPTRDDDYEGPSRCMRQCLQDCDRAQCNPVGCHVGCLDDCLHGLNHNPF